MRGTALQTSRSVQMEREKVLQVPEQRFHGPHWKSVSPPHEEQAAAETTCDKLTAALIPHPPAPLKLNPGKKGEMGEDLFLFLTTLL